MLSSHGKPPILNVDDDDDDSQDSVTWLTIENGTPCDSKLTLYKVS